MWALTFLSLIFDVIALPVYRQIFKGSLHKFSMVASESTTITRFHTNNNHISHVCIYKMENVQVLF
jgi:hypothetical protein